MYFCKNGRRDDETHANHRHEPVEHRLPFRVRSQMTFDRDFQGGDFICQDVQTAV
jgi:hypothetical protein